MEPGSTEIDNSMKFSEVLNDERRKKLNDEFRVNERLVKLLGWMQPKGNRGPDALSWVSNLVDSQQGGGGMIEKLLVAKLDMVRFINDRITVDGGTPEDDKAKKWQYKQAMEGLFNALGMMQPQEEYRLLSDRTKLTEYSFEDKALRNAMEQRKTELEQDYGIRAEG